MTSVIERAIEFIAPNSCILCSNYDNILCCSCAYSLQGLLLPACLLCGQESADWRVCSGCQKAPAPDSIIAATAYEGAIKELIRKYKFEHVRSACAPLAGLICTALPYLPKEYFVVAVPTASAHIRQRGYDHAKLIATQVARQKSLKFVPALERRNDYRQMGKNRKQRQEQAINAFVARKNVQDKSILLIDDVCTTGATLRAATSALMEAGAAEVLAAVVAWKQ